MKHNLKRGREEGREVEREGAGEGERERGGRDLATLAGKIQFATQATHFDHFFQGQQIHKES